MKHGSSIDYQTMLKKSVFLLDGSNPEYKNGINIFLLVVSQDQCFSTISKLSSVPQSENVSQSVNVSIEYVQDRRLLSSMITLAFYGTMCILGYIILFKSPSHYDVEWVGRFSQAQRNIQKHLTTLRSNQTQSTKPQPDENSDPVELSQISIIGDPTQQFTPLDVISAENTAIQCSTANTNSPILKWEYSPKSFSVRKAKAYNSKRSSQYTWLIIIVGIYYTLPVVQLVFLYQTMSTEGGNKDLCYYNFECQFPWWGVQDFGNIFSNVGYVILGLVFLTIVWYRSLNYKQFKQRLEELNIRSKYGITEQFGIYTALGIALVLEGVLSASYHICPTEQNFQFDTTFMYFIAVLLFLKVYQFRHPNGGQHAVHVFVLLGCALIMEALGYFIQSVAFTVVFILLYSILLSTFLYPIYWEGNSPPFRRALTLFSTGCIHLCKNPKDLKDLSWNFISIVVINFLMALAIFLMQNPEGASMYLLAIFIVNMILYFCYYVSRKIYLYKWKNELNESISWISWLYLFLANSTALPSLYFFMTVERTTSVSPAQSRSLNAPCSIGIYDYHDIWHFLSAAGLFFLYLFILTLEDGNMETKRNKIKVF